MLLLLPGNRMKWRKIRGGRTGGAGRLSVAFRDAQKSDHLGMHTCGARIVIGGGRAEARVLGCSLAYLATSAHISVACSTFTNDFFLFKTLNCRPLLFHFNVCCPSLRLSLKPASSIWTWSKYVCLCLVMSVGRSVGRLKPTDRASNSSSSVRVRCMLSAIEIAIQPALLF